MRQVSDAFLLNMAEVSSALVGLFLVGVFFFVETGVRRSGHTTEVMEPYFRASTRIVLALYAIPIGLSLTLVALEPAWTRVLFVLLSVALVAANVDTVRRVRALTKVFASATLVMTELVGSIGVAVLVVLPWALGGLSPTREDLTWSVLLAFGAGFLGIWAVVLTAFDIARLQNANDVELDAS